jgi:MoaA/NifB/PqqE/SkfB family radical SAM enzyme
MRTISKEEPFYNYNALYEANELSLWLDISTHCNAKCPQCHRTNADGLQKVDWLPVIQWSAEEFKSAFTPKTLTHIDRIDICGTWGDPMMNKEIFEIVKYIMDFSDCKILINTNGSIRNPDWWWKFGLLGKERITVMFAVDGITQEQHSLYRQDTDLDTVLDNMETFVLAGGIAEVFTVAFRHNEKDLYNIAEEVHRRGAIDIFYVPSNRFKRDSTKFDFIDKKGEMKFLEKSTMDEINTPDFFWKVHVFEENALERIKNATS